MTTLREAAQQALEALCLPCSRWNGTQSKIVNDAITALRAALAEPDLDRCPRCGGPADNGHDREVPPNPYYCTKCMAEPVAWMYEDTLPKEYPYDAMWSHSAVRDGVRMFPVFAPPQPAEPIEPVAWSYELATTMLEHGYDGWEHRITRYKPNVPEGSIRNLTPLYAAPPQRKPLTEEEIEVLDCIPSVPGILFGDVVKLARAIERAHEIGGEE